jgi:L-threonylcarbamoyladenylate synthase
MPTLQPTPANIRLAAEHLREGGLVAFPTETVYGLGANALDVAAVRRIYAAKGRPSFNPLIVHLFDADQAQSVVAAWPAAAQELADAFWPGPLTLVLPKRSIVPDDVTAGLASVAIRVPAHPLALELLRAAALPVAAPSANRYTEVSPTTAAHVARSLGADAALILDGGATEVGIESTVVDLTGAHPVVLRPGMISLPQIADVVGTVDRIGTVLLGDLPRPAPGMVERHYAPRARLMVAGDTASARDAAATELSQGGRPGLVSYSSSTLDGVTTEALPADAGGYAARLYGTLHALDESGHTLIIVEQVPDDPAWEGVRDRISRASAAER